MTKEEKEFTPKEIILGEWFALLAISTLFVFPIFSIFDGLRGFIILVTVWILGVGLYFIESENESFSSRKLWLFHEINRKTQLRCLLYLIIGIFLIGVSLLTQIYLYISTSVFLMGSCICYFLGERKTIGKKNKEEK